MKLALSPFNGGSARISMQSPIDGFVGSSQSIADKKYSASNHPLLRDRESVYNINNPPLGSLE